MKAILFGFILLAILCSGYVPNMEHPEYTRHCPVESDWKYWGEPDDEGRPDKWDKPPRKYLPGTPYFYLLRG